jgi:hypothetical protein
MVGWGAIPIADVKEIRVIGGDGADNISVIPNLNVDHTINVPFDIPVTFIGGGGDDTLIGGQGADTLIGGPGRDFIDGGASQWLDREWLDHGWQGTDSMHFDLPRYIVGDDTIGGGIQGEVLDGESDGNDMPPPPAAPVNPRPAVQPTAPPTQQPAASERVTSGSSSVTPPPPALPVSPFSTQPLTAATNGPAVLGDPAAAPWDILD